MTTCPRCHVSLVAAEYDGVDVPMCPQCQGRWIDSEHLRAVLDAVEAPADAPAPVPPRSAGSEAEKREKARLPCPSCGVEQHPFNYAGDTGIILDKCPACGRIWLDGGQLDEVRRAVAASRAGVNYDAKRFSATLHEVEVREDKMEQQDATATPTPALTALLSRDWNQKDGV